MKISIYLKVTLCAFLCSIVCVIGFMLTNIDIFAVLVNWLWLISYGGLVAWLCSKIRRKVRYGINLCFCIASFAIALYLGVTLSLQDEFNLAFINNLENLSLPELAFIVFSVVCVFSTMILICRFIFGTPKNNTVVEVATAVIQESEQAESEQENK